MRISDWSSDVCSSDLLSITKQSLGRVLHDLQERGLVESRVGASDRRQRLLRLSPAGEALERELYEQLRTGVADAYRRAGQSAGAGFWTVLEGLIPEDEREIGSASCRERVVHAVSIAEVAVTLKK